MKSRTWNPKSKYCILTSESLGTDTSEWQNHSSNPTACPSMKAWLWITYINIDLTVCALVSWRTDAAILKVTIYTISSVQTWSTKTTINGCCTQWTFHTIRTITPATETNTNINNCLLACITLKHGVLYTCSIYLDYSKSCYLGPFFKPQLRLRILMFMQNALLQNAGFKDLGTFSKCP